MRRNLTRDLKQLALNVVLLLACLLFLQDAWTPIAIALVVASVLLIGWFGRRAPADRFAAPRVLAIIALAIQAWALYPAEGRPLAVAVLSGALLVLMDASLRRGVARPLWATHLPGFDMPRVTVVVGGPAFYVSLAVTLLLAVTAAGWLPPITLAVVTVLGTVAVVTSVLLVARKPPAALTEAIVARLEEYAPEFLVYFSAPRDSEYQVLMWLPYLDRLGKRYAILTREVQMYRSLESRVSVPLLRARTLATTEAALVSSLSTVFYVNNGSANVHTVRFQNLTHVQLLHGDSDKPPSFSPVTAMYDKVFVAGQAGIDRYEAHGVEIPLDKFVIVGRPQVEAINVSRQPVPATPPRTVLYAPTWAGQFSDTSLSSLPMGERIVSALLEHGEIVWFRPHPYSYRNSASAAQISRIEQLLADAAKATGLPHQWGAAVGGDRPLFDCFNAADALVTDVSSVAADFLFSGKPFAISDVGLGGDDSEEVFPLVRAAYLLPQEGDLTPVLDAMVGPDPLREVRSRLRTYYLGDLPEENYADVFIERATAVIDAARDPRRSLHHESGTDDQDDD